MDSSGIQARASMTDKMKKACLEALYTKGSNDDDDDDTTKGTTYLTSASKWVRSRGASSHIFTLLKVKRWLLNAEDFIFDPLKKCEAEVEVTPFNTLWSTFGEDEQARLESYYCLDGIIAVAVNMAAEGSIVTLEGLRALDSVFDLLDQYQKPKTRLQLQRFLETVQLLPTKDLYAATPFTEAPFLSLMRAITIAVNGSTCNEVVPGKTYENVFARLVQCVAACLGDDRRKTIYCETNIDGHVQAKVQLDVKLEEAMSKPLGLEIKAIPDLYIFGSQRLSATPAVVLAVVEVKGMHKDTILHSDDEDNVTTHVHGMRSLSKVSKQNLPVLDEDDEEDDDEDDETEMELTSTPPVWLRSTRTLPYSAQNTLKKFLPQLMGEMLCVSRSKRMLPLKLEDGLLFGVGVIGFDVYFVSMLDSCRDSPESVINTESANTKVFVTRPLNLFVKKDRRIILKTICALLLLCPPEIRK